jgi:hypothetical protein
VYVCTSITHKDLLDTHIGAMCFSWISCREIKESIRLRWNVRTILRLGGHAEPVEVGKVLRQSGIRDYNICFCRRKETENKL